MMIVTKDATDVTSYFHLRLAADGTDATGLTVTNMDLQYCRSGATPAAKVDASALGAANSAHADNSAIEVDATDTPGLYRVDWPDAAFATGVDEVILTVKVATAFTESLRVRLISATRGLAGTALPNAAADAAGGLPISDAGGLDLDAQIGTDIDAILVDTAEIGAAGAGLTNINLPNQTMDIVGNITGNLSGSVGSVTGAVGSVTGAVGSVAAGGITASSIATDAIDADALADGAITAATFAAGAIDATAIAANAIGASELAADAVTEIQSGLATAASIAALNNLSAAQVNSEVDTALADIHLDHLIGVADPGSIVANSSLLAKLTSKSATPAFTSFDNTTDSLEAIRDKAVDVETDTQDIQTKIGTPAGASVSADIAAIEAQTDDIGAAGAGLTAVPWNAAWDAEVQSEVQDAFDATLADSVPSDGTRPSMAQAAYAIYQFLTERSVSGTTLTVKKVDGSTTLMTFTLNDASTPTSITRTT